MKLAISIISYLNYLQSKEVCLYVQGSQGLYVHVCAHTTFKAVEAGISTNRLYITCSYLFVCMHHFRSVLYIKLINSHVD